MAGDKAGKRRPLILAATPAETPAPEQQSDFVGPLPQVDPAGDVEAEREAEAPLTPAEARRRARAERTATRTLPPAPPLRVSTPVEAGPLLVRWAYPVAGITALIWIGALAAFVAGYERRAWAFDYAPFRLAIAGALALLPALFMLLFAYAVRQGARLAAEARRARSLSDDLTTPVMLAASGAVGAAQAVREEVGRLKGATDEASRRMTELRRTLAEESQLLTEAAATAERSARTLGGRLQSERAELGGLASTLDAQTTAAAESLARQSRLVADASDLAQAQMVEAEAALTSRTADLLAAASSAERAATGAGDAMGVQNTRLERLAVQLAKERDGLVAASERLFANQDDVLARAENLQARLAAAAHGARDEAKVLIEASTAGAGSLKGLVAEATVHVKSLAEASRQEQASIGDRARAGLAAMAGDAAKARASVEADTRAALERMRQSAEDARNAASTSAAALLAQSEAAGKVARTQVDELAQAAFDVGRRADQAFDARLASARRAIDAQATLVEDAGLRAATRIEAGVAAARTALGEMEGLVTELESRLAHAPDEARTRIEALRSAVDSGVEDVTNAARRAEAEAQAADHAFQDSVRRSYDTLVDAIRDIGEAPSEAVDAPPPVAPPAPEDDLFPVSTLWRSEDVAPPAVPELRTRLRLAPTAEDAAEVALFASSTPAEPEPPADGDDWSWKDLLGGMDEEGAIDDEVLAERLLGEFAAMGVDAAALLPRAYVDEIARTLHVGEMGQAREAVRRLAPAAVRRLSRRVMTDKVMRDEADLYRRRYGELLTAAARGDEEGVAIQALLGSDPGRAYLLLEAAAGDLH